MDDKKKIYSRADFESYTAAVKRECEQTLIRQRERIEELKADLAKSQERVRELEGQKELVYKAITAAVRKADDMERVALIKYNQEIAQLKSFHNKWIGYFNKIIEKYPLDDDLVEAGKVNGRIAKVLEKAGDVDAALEAERAKLEQSLSEEDIYADDRSPAGFSFQEALHPKDDLKDIMKELGIVID